MFVMAVSRYRRQKYDECAALCTEFLQHNARDQAAWLLKCRALTQKNWVDDLEIEEEGVADLLMGSFAAMIRRECCFQCSKTRHILRKAFDGSAERDGDIADGAARVELGTADFGLRAARNKPAGVREQGGTAERTFGQPANQFGAARDFGRKIPPSGNGVDAGARG